MSRLPERLSSIFEKEIEEAFVSRLNETLATAREYSELKNVEDQQVIKSYLRLKKSVGLAYIFAHSIIVKTRVLVEHIHKSNDYIIEQVQEGNADVLKRHVEVLLSTSKTFQKDIDDLRQLLTKRLKPLVAEEKQKNQPQGGLLQLWQVQEIKPPIKDAVVYAESLIETIKTAVMARVNEQMKLGIDNNIESIDEESLHKISRKSRAVQRGTVSTLQTLDVQSRQLLEYCSSMDEMLPDLKPALCPLWLCSHCFHWNIEGNTTTCTNCEEPIVSRTKDHQIFYRAMKEGQVKYTVSTAVVQGEARAGKTSLRCLLLSQPYNKLSTSCMETPQVAINRFTRTGKIWSPVEDEEMDLRTIAKLNTIVTMNYRSVWSYRVDSINKEARGNITTIPKADDAQSSQENHSHSPLKQHVVKTDSRSEMSVQVSSNPSVSDKEAEEAIATVKEFYKVCESRSSHSIEGGSSHHEDWLYFIDSGGQIQFQKLLPAFMPFASVLIIVLNLGKKLSDPSSTAMQLHDRQISVSEHSLTVEEILKQLLSAIVSSAQQYMLMIDPGISSYIKPPSGKLSVIAVATHHDQYSQQMKEGKTVESIDTKEEKLDGMFSSVDSISEVVRNPEPPFNILYMVDGRKALRNKFDDPVIEQIAEKLKRQSYEIKVPIKWHCFVLLLRQKAKDGCGVLSLSSCQALGEQLGMSLDNVKSALKFFHILKMLLYYPDSPVKEMVFVRLNSLIDILSELVVIISDSRSRSSLPSIVEELVTEGLLSIEVLQRSKKFMEVSNAFDDFGDKLLKLFEHLLIAVALPEKTCYFMPALLPVKAVSGVNPFPDTTPLLFYFKNAVPMGLFCAFIVHLLSLKEHRFESTENHFELTENGKENSWRIIRRPNNFSNYITLQNIKAEGSFVFVETLDCFEIHAEHPNYIVAKAMKKAIELTVNDRKANVKAIKAFYCPCGKGQRHLAEVVYENSQQYVLHCIYSKEHVKEHRADLWFKNTTAVNVDCESTDSSPPTVSQCLPNGVLDEAHASVILSTISDLVDEWETLGIHLGLTNSMLQEIKHNCFYQVGTCRKDMIIKWLQLGTATRPALISALMKIRRGDIVAKIQSLPEE